jgi:hypothetical protein
VQRSRTGASSRAGDCDGSRPWKLEHCRVADQCGRQREPRRRGAHKRRRLAVRPRRLGSRHRAGDQADDPCHGGTPWTRAGGACERSRERQGPRGLHRPAARANRRLGRKDGRAQARTADTDVQARSPHGSARTDPCQREARSPARGHEHASPQGIAPHHEKAVALGAR